MRPLTPLLRVLPLLPSSAVVLLTLMVGAPQAAEAQSCSVDPYGAEVPARRQKEEETEQHDGEREKGQGADRMVVIPDCRALQPVPPRTSLPTVRRSLCT